jgi:hypothetical protein
MYRPTMMRQALRLGLPAILFVLAISVCGGGSGEEQADKPRSLPEERKDLLPGEYRSEEFKPSLTFRLGKEWANDPPEVSEELGLTWRWKGTANFYFFNLRKVFKPGTHIEVEAPKDMVVWFQHHPYLQTSKPKPVTVGGVKGQQFDVVVEVPESYSGYCGSECVDMAMLTSGGGLIAWVEDIKERVIVLEDVKGETVVIDFGAPPGEKFDEFTSESQKVVDSVKWTES